MDIFGSSSLSAAPTCQQGLEVGRMKELGGGGRGQSFSARHLHGPIQKSNMGLDIERRKELVLGGEGRISQLIIVVSFSNMPKWVGRWQDEETWRWWQWRSLLKGWRVSEVIGEGGAFLLVIFAVSPNVPTWGWMLKG